MFEAWNVAKGWKVQGGRILSQGTVYQWRLVTEKFGEDKTRGDEPVHGVMLFYPIVNSFPTLLYSMKVKQ